MPDKGWIVFELEFRGFYNWVASRDTWNELINEYSYQWLLETQQNNNSIAPSFGEGIKYSGNETLGAWFKKNGINPMPQ